MAETPGGNRPNRRSDTARTSKEKTAVPVAIKRKREPGGERRRSAGGGDRVGYLDDLPDQTKGSYKVWMRVTSSARTSRLMRQEGGTASLAPPNGVEKKKKGRYLLQWPDE